MFIVFLSYKVNIILSVAFNSINSMLLFSIIYDINQGTTFVEAPGRSGVENLPPLEALSLASLSSN
jgi:hypothetical protein